MKNAASAAREVGTAQTLLEEHRELLSLVERIEALCADQAIDTSHHPLEALLEGLIQALAAHLEAEHDSIDRDFEDVPRLRAAFIELDKDHPKLLAGFGEALQALRSRQPWRTVRDRVEHAVVAFREHEEREDALFAAHS